jgi:hypothetical protein
MVKKMTLFSGVILMLLLNFSPASGQDASENPHEKILDFQSRVEVHADASFTVTETIRVSSLQYEIRHGIYRDFPVVYRNRFYLNEVRPFEVIQVLKNGKTEPYRIENHDNMKRVYIGSPEAVLEPGEYEYTLIYKTAKQLLKKDNQHDFYWNVTGHGWSFPIIQASLTVVLPAESREIENIQCYTGS